MSLTIKPLGDRIVAILEPAAPKTASGILLPENAQEAPLLAKVVATGPKSELLADDRILYKEFAATNITVEGEEYLVINEEDVLAVVNEEK